MKEQIPNDNAHKKYCECDDPKCFLVIDIDDAVYRKLHSKKQLIISSHCEYGVRSVLFDLIEVRDGYTVYSLK